MHNCNTVPPPPLHPLSTPPLPHPSHPAKFHQLPPPPPNYYDVIPPYGVPVRSKGRFCENTASAKTSLCHGTACRKKQGNVLSSGCDSMHTSTDFITCTTI
uniref:Uncharacterized protein n=1 Tax=Lygus hesperus TaxID=30085 RepID=A0A0A9WDF6_LYGHE